MDRCISYHLRRHLSDVGRCVLGFGVRVGNREIRLKVKVRVRVRVRVKLRMRVIVGRSGLD